MAQPLGYLFSGYEYPEGRTQGPKVKCTRGKLHMMAHDDLTTRDESVKRGGGSVAVLEIRINIIKVPQIRYFGKCMCS